MLRVFVFVSCLFLSFSLSAIQRYETTVAESNWRVTQTPVHCEMVHEISHYGDGRFVYTSGGELAFQLRVNRAAPKDSVASLHSIAPFWHEPYEKELAQLSISKGKMPVYVGGSLALRLLYELQAGHHPTLLYKDWADYEEDVIVSVSSVNFHRVYDDFQECIGKALAYGPDQVKDTVVYFETNRHNLTEQQARSLREIILFASIDLQMKIEINGHADGRGKRAFNKALSERRSSEVEKYLVAQGVSAAQISKRSFGESRPVGNNATDSGRSKNRRVNVIIDH